MTENKMTQDNKLEQLTDDCPTLKKVFGKAQQFGLRLEVYPLNTNRAFTARVLSVREDYSIVSITTEGKHQTESEPVILPHNGTVIYDLY